MLEYEDFATLGTYLHHMTQCTYSRIIHFIDSVKLLR